MDKVLHNFSCSEVSPILVVVSNMNESEAAIGDCPDPWGDPETAKFLTEFIFWFGVVFYSCVGSLGCLGNMITISIFSLKTMKRSV